MPTIKAAASYKKQDGILLFDDPKNAITWTPKVPSKSLQPLVIAVTDITNLQQTPAASAKVALKIATQPKAASEVENHVFNFTSADDARAEQEAVTGALRNAITAARAITPSLATPESGATAGEGQSAAMAIAQAVRSGTKGAETWYDDKKLISNSELQQSLFEKDPALRKRFQQSLREKPDDISHAQFGAQFWTARINLLRSHAIERSQSQGAYNVLAEIKETNVDGARKLSLTKEHIQAMFNQHPIIKHVYNETVPNKLKESEFWARFFDSKLLRKLKGESIGDGQPTDHILDKYLNFDETALRNRQLETHIPHFIDLEGNEQNHSQRQGNKPDWTMRPEASGKVPILRVLNNMSEKMMAGVTPADGEPYGPVGMDEETFNELRLRDLQSQEEEDRIVLNIKDQGRLFRSGTEKQASEESKKYAKMDPNKTIAALRKNLKHHIHLEPSASDLENTGRSTAQIMSLISQQKDLLSNALGKTNLSADSFQSLLLTHNTTTEFLHYFWTLLLSIGNGASESTKKDLVSLYSTLTKSSERIAAVAEAAEKERQARISELKRSALEYQSKTGKRRKVDESAVLLGGRKEVESLMEPTIRAIAFAKEKFEIAVGG